jgi:hypothetical protein
MEMQWHKITENIMPNVAGKKYPYTKVGMAAAKKAAATTGRPLRTAASKASRLTKKKTKRGYA